MCVSLKAYFGFNNLISADINDKMKVSAECYVLCKLLVGWLYGLLKIMLDKLMFDKSIYMFIDGGDEVINIKIT